MAFRCSKSGKRHREKKARKKKIENVLLFVMQVVVYVNIFFTPKKKNEGVYSS